VDRLRVLFGALVMLFAVLVPTGSASASEAPVAPAAQMGPVVPQGAIVLLTGFYCPGATAPGSPCMPCRPDVGSASCPYTYKVPSKGGSLTIQITNHANYGEHCYVMATNGGRLGDEWINQGDNSEHWVGTVNIGQGYQARCQRRAATGDAGIGGYLWVDHI
jgi:hypothetical protein